MFVDLSIIKPKMCPISLTDRFIGSSFLKSFFDFEFFFPSFIFPLIVVSLSPLFISSSPLCVTMTNGSLLLTTAANPVRALFSAACVATLTVFFCPSDFDDPPPTSSSFFYFLIHSFNVFLSLFLTVFLFVSLWSRPLSVLFLVPVFSLHSMFSSPGSLFPSL